MSKVTKSRLISAEYFTCVFVLSSRLNILNLWLAADNVMEKLILKETSKTPFVSFDPDRGIFEIRGKSIPENSISFYTPIFNFLEGYSNHPAERTVLSVKLEFFNTSSSNRIHMLFKKFEKLYLGNREVLIKWYCENGDENMFDAGADFKAILRVPFEIVRVEEL